MDKPKFIVDMNVGRLARWLRALGYDTLFINPIADDELVRIAEEQNRVILTKDAGIFERRPVKAGVVSALLIKSTEFRDQLAQVIRECGLERSGVFSRCLVCNCPLAPVGAEEARRVVPPRVAAVFEEYWQCLQCGRFYWKGSHWERMNKLLAHLFPSAC